MVYEHWTEELQSSNSLSTLETIVAVFGDSDYSRQCGQGLSRAKQFFGQSVNFSGSSTAAAKNEKKINSFAVFIKRKMASCPLQRDEVAEIRLKNIIIGRMEWGKAILNEALLSTMNTLSVR